MNDDLETQILNSTTPHVGGDDVDESDASKPVRQAVPSDPNASDPFDEKVFDVSSDFNISEAENLPAQRRAVTLPPAAPKPTIKPTPQTISSAAPTAPKSAMPQMTRAQAPGAPRPFISAATATPKPMTPANQPATGNVKPPADHPNIPQKALRTYETDVMDVLAHTKVSATSMALAENKKKGEVQSLKTKERAEESTHIVIKLLIALASAALIGGGAFGAYYLYTISPLAPVQQSVIQQPQIAAALVPADTSVFVPIDNLSNEDAGKQIIAEMNKTQAPNTIKEIIPTRVATDGTVVRVPGPDMLAIADVAAPDILSRSLTSPWMFGVYVDNKNQKSIFIVATTNFFQNAFAGMLQWESAMPENFHKFIQPLGLAPAVAAPSTPQTILGTSTDRLSGLSASLPTATPPMKAATTTAPRPPIHKKASSGGEISGGTPPGTPPAPTSTASLPGATVSASSSDSGATTFVSSYVPITGAFIDRIIKNKDVREFKDAGGNILFMYSFLDNTHIILASSETALAEAITRVENQAFVR